MPVQPNPRAAWPSHDDNSGFFLIVTLIGLGILSLTFRIFDAVWPLPDCPEDVL